MGLASHAVCAVPATSAILALSPQLWLDASDAGSVTLNSGNVSQINDKSGNGRHFTQGSAGSQPAYLLANKNGLNVISFDGVDDTLMGATASDFTFLHDGTNWLLAAVWDPGTAGVRGMIGNQNGGDTAGLALYQTAGNNVLVRITSPLGGNCVSATFANGMPNSAFSVNTFLVDPDNATAASRSSSFLNAGSASTTNASSAATNTTAATRKLAVGSLSASGSVYGNGCNGRIAELIIVAGANATEGNRTILRDYLNAKWAVY